MLVFSGLNMFFSRSPIELGEVFHSINYRRAKSLRSDTSQSTGPWQEPDALSCVFLQSSDSAWFVSVHDDRRNQCKTWILPQKYRGTKKCSLKNWTKWWVKPCCCQAIRNSQYLFETSAPWLQPFWFHGDQTIVPSLSSKIIFTRAFSIGMKMVYTVSITNNNQNSIELRD